MKTKYLIFLLIIISCYSCITENTDCNKQQLELWRRGRGRVGSDLTYVIKGQIKSCWNDSVAISLAFKEISKHLDTTSIFWNGIEIEILDENILSYRRNDQSDNYFENRLYALRFYYLDKNYVEIYNYKKEPYINILEDIKHEIPDSLVQKMKNVANKEQ